MSYYNPIVPISPLIPPDLTIFSQQVTQFSTNNITQRDPTTYKTNVRVATISLVQLLGIQTIDGITLSFGDRILVKDNPGVDNGIYIVGAVWQRADDLPNNTNALGVTIYVLEGLQNSNVFFVCNGPVSGAIIDVDEITFEPLRYLYSGPDRSIQYNYSLYGTNNMYGSEAFKYIVNYTNDDPNYPEYTLQLGPYINNINNGHECIIELLGDNIFGSVHTVGTSETNIDTNLVIQSGSQIFLRDKICRDGEIIFSTFGETSGDITIISGQSSTNSGNINLILGYDSPPPENNPGNIILESGYCNFSSGDADDYENILLDTDVVTIQTNSSDTLVQKGGIVFSKESTTLDFSLTNGTANGRSCIISGSNSYVLLPGESKRFVIFNDQLDEDTLIITNITTVNSYLTLVVVDKTVTSFTVLFYNNSTIDSIDLDSNLYFTFMFY